MDEESERAKHYLDPSTEKLIAKVGEYFKFEHGASK